MNGGVHLIHQCFRHHLQHTHAFLNIWPSVLLQTFPHSTLNTMGYLTAELLKTGLPDLWYLFSPFKSKIWKKQLYTGRRIRPTAIKWKAFYSFCYCRAREVKVSYRIYNCWDTHCLQTATGDLSHRWALRTYLFVHFKNFTTINVFCVCDRMKSWWRTNTLIPL